jgi:hypothetical protein
MGAVRPRTASDCRRLAQDCPNLQRTTQENDGGLQSDELCHASKAGSETLLACFATDA